MNGITGFMGEILHANMTSVTFWLATVIFLGYVVSKAKYRLTHSIFHPC